jgi:hypothetical protein
MTTTRCRAVCCQHLDGVPGLRQKFLNILMIVWELARYARVNFLPAMRCSQVRSRKLISGLAKESIPVRTVYSAALSETLKGLTVAL